MNETQIKAILIEELQKLAPEIDPEDIDPDADLREEIDIDSMDFLNLTTALHERLAVDIPEVDYDKLRTLNEAVDYFIEKG